jgi:hypothetical protein
MAPAFRVREDHWYLKVPGRGVAKSGLQSTSASKLLARVRGREFLVFYVG